MKTRLFSSFNVESSDTTSYRSMSINGDATPGSGRPPTQQDMDSPYTLSSDQKEKVAYASLLGMCGGGCGGMFAGPAIAGAAAGSAAGKAGIIGITIGGPVGGLCAAGCVGACLCYQNKKKFKK